MKWEALRTHVRFPPKIGHSRSRDCFPKLAMRTDVAPGAASGPEADNGLLRAGNKEVELCFVCRPRLTDSLYR